MRRTSAVPLRDEASLNIVIPMGGSGEAFREAGYTAPKPVIKVAGRPLLLHLLDSLRLRLGDVVWLIIPTSTYLKFQSQLDLNAEYPNVDIRVCQFSCLTRGAVETIFIGLQNMSAAELSRRTLCLDCDTLYFSDVLSMYRTAPSGTGMCAYFIDQGTAALYSYLQLDADGYVTEVSEKNAISNLANIGAYGFATGALLRSFIQDILDNPEGRTTELFLSNVINRMIRQSHPFVASQAEDCAQCGTPEKLEQFMELVSAGKALTQPKRRFCFALDVAASRRLEGPITPGCLFDLSPLISHLSPLTSDLSPPTSHLPPLPSHLPLLTSHLPPLASRLSALSSHLSSTYSLAALTGVCPHQSVALSSYSEIRPRSRPSCHLLTVLPMPPLLSGRMCLSRRPRRQATCRQSSPSRRTSSSSVSSKPAVSKLVSEGSEW